MRLTLVTPPAGLPVTLEDVKTWVRVDADYFDMELTTMAGAATARLDGPAGLLGRCLLATTWIGALDTFPDRIELPLPPCISVDSIMFEDALGASQVVQATDYVVSGLGSEDGAVISPRVRWPHASSVQVRFTAGYGPTPESVPPGIREAIMMHVSFWFYNNRGNSLDKLPKAWDELVFPYRVAGV